MTLTHAGTEVKPFTRSFEIGRIDTGYSRRAVVTVDVIYSADGRLSLTGTAQRPGARDIDEGGQMQDTIARMDADDLNPSISPAVRDKLVAVWERWHLNDMRAGCEHQRAEGWNERPIDPSKPTNTYGRHFEGQRQDSWNLLGWVRPDEHPDGLLTLPCSVCGYRYGTAWQREDVPYDVLHWLRDVFPKGL